MGSNGGLGVESLATRAPETQKVLVRNGVDPESSRKVDYH